MTYIYDRLTKELCTWQREAKIPECMTKGKIKLIHKPQKWTILSNSNILPAQIKKKFTTHLTAAGFFPKKKKDTTKELEVHIIVGISTHSKKSKNEKKNVTIASINYKNVVCNLTTMDRKCLKMLNFSDQEAKFLTKALKTKRRN